MLRTVAMAPPMRRERFFHDKYLGHDVEVARARAALSPATAARSGRDSGSPS